MKVSDFDKESGEGAADIVDGVDLSRATRRGKERRRVNIELPLWMVESLDREGRLIGVTRQSIIKVWLADRLERIA